MGSEYKVNEWPCVFTKKSQVLHCLFIILKCYLCCLLKSFRELSLFDILLAIQSGWLSVYLSGLLTSPPLCLCVGLIRKWLPCFGGETMATVSHVLTSQHVKYNRFSCHTTTCSAVDPRLDINTCFPSHNCSSNGLVCLDGEKEMSGRHECTFLQIYLCFNTECVRLWLNSFSHYNLIRKFSGDHKALWDDLI